VNAKMEFFTVTDIICFTMEKDMKGSWKMDLSKAMDNITTKMEVFIRVPIYKI
jgi:hypothetical protein